MNENNEFNNNQQPENDEQIKQTTHTSPLNNEGVSEQLEHSNVQESVRKTSNVRKKKGGSKVGYFLSGLSGVIIGALVLWLMMPSLVDQLPSKANDVSSSSNKEAQTITQNATAVSTDVTSAVEKVSEAVVGITNIQESNGGFWMQQSEQAVGSGSGVIYKIENNKAFIITNYHVVEGANQLEVTLADGSKEEAELIGSDVWTDLAVIVIDAKNIQTVAQFGDSDVLKVGEAVIAIGNPLGLDFYGSVTQGIVSGKDRSVPVDLDADGVSDWTTEVLQTDAAINQGNSGGALVNLAGELIGINSMKIASSTVEGLGFSIPINSAIPIIEELEENGEVKRPTMGISLMDLTEVPAFYQQNTLNIPNEVTTGVVVTEIVRGSAADRAGMEAYDVIVEMDGKKIENAIDLRKHLYNEKEVGDTLKIKVYRKGKLQELNLTLIDNTTL
jgi:serine protease Do